MKRLCHIFALAAIAVLIAIPVSAQISKPVGLLKGDIESSNGDRLTGVNVSIFKGTELITSTKSNSDGKFTEILQPNATYRIAVTSDEYGYTENTIVVPPLDHYQEFPMHVVLTAFHDGEMFPIDYPVFLPKSSVIESIATPDLEKIVEQMRHNPKVSLIVTVFPDAKIKNKKDAQQRLVNSRAAAIRSFFLGKNIPASRVTVLTGSTVPPGRFASNEVVSRTSAKKKKSKAKPKLIPQYVEIAAHMGNG